VRPAKDAESPEVFYLVAWSVRIVGGKTLSPLDLTRRFAESYLRCPAGTDHRLTLIFKGFQAPGYIAEHCSLFPSTSPSVIEVPDVEIDVGLYRAALEKSGSDLYCALNAYSIICASGWLAELSRCARDPRVGIVGAHGSYESIFSTYRAGLMASINRQKPGFPVLRGIATAVRSWARFPAFPNPHIRTNAFMISREVFQRVRWPRNPNKMDALLFESGRRSLTRQVLGMGLDAVIVGRDGRHYGISEWPSSGTFRQKDQDNLLVADNHTIEYSTAPPERRRQLAANVWGTSAAE
jgi:hypothetical protein